MIIVTGGAGFIGSNIVKGLNRRARNDIMVVGDLSDGKKFENLVDCQIADYIDKDDLLTRINQGQSLGKIDAIFHQGACSSTTEWNGRFMMQNNYDYSKALLHYSIKRKIPFLYASSAAVYGGSQIFREEPSYEVPLNVYGYSKLLFDQYVRRLLPQTKSPIVGFRYFNVYGPREQHKASMVSVAYQLHQQMRTEGKIKLFAGYDGYQNGEQSRDFIYVSDVVDVNLWFLDHPQHSGIFNLGTGKSETFNAVAQAVQDWHGKGEIEYVPFPEKLKGCYQSFTQADISRLRSAGYTAPFKNVAQGVRVYLDGLEATSTS